MTSYLTKCLIPITALALLLSAASSANAQTAVDEKISETKSNLQKLLQIKDNTELGTEERERQELELKKSIVLDILDISSMQLQRAKELLEKTAFPQSDDWQDVREHLFSQFDSHAAFYNETAERVKTESDLTLADMQEMAKSIEQRKLSAIDPLAQSASNAASVFGISDILKLATERLTKVASDVHKLYSQKAITGDSLKKSLAAATKLVSEAREKNNRSKEIMLHMYGSEGSSSDSSAGRFIEVFDGAVQAYVFEKMKQEASASAAPTPAASPLPGSPSEITVTQTLRNGYLQDLILQSAAQVREAYDIFLRMSMEAKEYSKE